MINKIYNGKVLVLKMINLNSKKNYKLFLSQIKIKGLLKTFDLRELKKISKKILFFSPGTIKIGLELTYRTI